MSVPKLQIAKATAHQSTGTVEQEHQSGAIGKSKSTATGKRKSTATGKRKSTATYHSGKPTETMSQYGSNRGVEAGHYGAPLSAVSSQRKFWTPQDLNSLIERSKGGSIHDVGWTENGKWGAAGAGLLVITTDHRRILLLKRSSSMSEPYSWGIPGGAVAAGESSNPAEATARTAIKEALEEMGQIPEGRLGQDPHIDRDTKSDFSYTTYLLEVEPKVADSFLPRLNAEHTDAQWFDVDKIPHSMLHPGVARLLENFFEKRPQPCETQEPLGRVQPRDWASLTDEELANIERSRTWTKSLLEKLELGEETFRSYKRGMDEQDLEFLTGLPNGVDVIRSEDLGLMTHYSPAAVAIAESGALKTGDRPYINATEYLRKEYEDLTGVFLTLPDFDPSELWMNVNFDTPRVNVTLPPGLLVLKFKAGFYLIPGPAALRDWLRNAYAAYLETGEAPQYLIDRLQRLQHSGGPQQPVEIPLSIESVDPITAGELQYRRTREPENQPIDITL